MRIIHTLYSTPFFVDVRFSLPSQPARPLVEMDEIDVSIFFSSKPTTQLLLQHYLYNSSTQKQIPEKKGPKKVKSEKNARQDRDTKTQTGYISYIPLRSARHQRTRTRTPSPPPPTHPHTRPTQKHPSNTYHPKIFKFEALYIHHHSWYYAGCPGVVLWVLSSKP